jgi:4,5-dihydroxyphthalate decarboxylase
MHTVAIRKDLVAQHPGLARTIYQSFCEAKNVAAEKYQHGRIFTYGIEANRKALDAILRYHFEQGITERRFEIEDIFVPELLTT